MERARDDLRQFLDLEAGEDGNDSESDEGEDLDGDDGTSARF